MRLAIAVGTERRLERVTCTCGAFLACVETQGPGRIELPRCRRCGVWPSVEVDGLGQVRLVLYGRRRDQERGR